MTGLRTRILERLIIDAQKNFGYEKIEKYKVYTKNNYEFLTERMDARHIVLDGRHIEIVYYSSDFRESPVSTNRFECIDDFLLSLFPNRFDIGSTFAAAKEIGSDALIIGGETADAFMASKKRTYDLLVSKFMRFMSTRKFFFYQLLLVIKVRRKQYFLYISHTTKFLAILFFIIFLLLWANGIIKDILLLMSGLLYIASNIRIEEALADYQNNRKIDMGSDRVTSAFLLLVLSFYFLHFYKIL